MTREQIERFMLCPQMTVTELFELCDLAKAGLDAPKLRTHYEVGPKMRELLEAVEADRQNLMGDGCTNDALGIRVQAALKEAGEQ